MKTRDRILLTSLQLFNEHGEPRITTNHIADELDISPGNLYYHFRSKDEIISLLFQQFERRMEAALQTPERRVPNMEDMWLYLHLVFESIWEYRFLYRDLDNILSRNKKLRTHFRRILERKISTATAICKGLVEAGGKAEDTEALIAPLLQGFEPLPEHRAMYEQRLRWGLRQYFLRRNFPESIDIEE